MAASIAARSLRNSASSDRTTRSSLIRSRPPRGQAEHLFIKADRPITHGVEGTAGNQDVAQHQAQAFGGRQLQTRVLGWNKLVEKLFEAKLIEEGVDDGQRSERFGNESGLRRQGILPEDDLTADVSCDIYTP